MEPCKYCESGAEGYVSCCRLCPKTKTTRFAEATTPHTGVAIIHKVRDPFGSLGNMSPHTIVHRGAEWKTSEALFQSMRFPLGHQLVSIIQNNKSPMTAKMTARAAASEMVVEPCSAEDCVNMLFVLMLKLSQHKDVRETLRSTKGLKIVEDCTRRQKGSGLFWGSAWTDGQWTGENTLGNLWMFLRDGKWPND